MRIIAIVALAVFAAAQSDTWGMECSSGSDCSEGECCWESSVEYDSGSYSVLLCAYDVGIEAYTYEYAGYTWTYGCTDSAVSLLAATAVVSTAMQFWWGSEEPSQLRIEIRLKSFNINILPILLTFFLFLYFTGSRILASIIILFYFLYKFPLTIIFS